MAPKVILFVFVAFLLVFAYVKSLESRAVFFPDKDFAGYPGLVGLDYKDIYFKSAGPLKLNAWYIPASGARYTVLFFHGNAGNLSDRLDKLKMLNSLGVNVFIVDYRGYGKSEGRPSESGIYKDAAAAYDYILREFSVSPQDIILYGESLGSAVVVDLASKKEAGGVIIEGGFSRGEDMAKLMFPLIPPVFFRGKFDSLSKIKNVRCPLLFLHSRQDQVVPYELSRKLYSAARSKAYFSQLSGEHNSAFMDSAKDYNSAISDFLSSLGGPRPAA